MSDEAVREGAMTDAGEKLRERAKLLLEQDGCIPHSGVEPCPAADQLVEFARNELERAAGIADRMSASSQKDADSTPDQAPISKEAFRIQAKGCWAIATAIRKLKE